VQRGGRGINRSRQARPLLGQDAQQADETSEGETDGHAVKQSKTDFLAARINREQRPQKPALPFHMNNAFRHSRNWQHYLCHEKLEHKTEAVTGWIVPISYTFPDIWSGDAAAKDGKSPLTLCGDNPTLLACAEI
jgi:hypothetical protein